MVAAEMVSASRWKGQSTRGKRRRTVKSEFNTVDYKSTEKHDATKNLPQNTGIHYYYTVRHTITTALTLQQPSGRALLAPL